jgi:hypothetical protein
MSVNGEHYEYEILFKINNLQYHRIHIFTMSNINDLYFSFQDYIFMIENIIENKIIMDKNITIPLNDLKLKINEKLSTNSNIIYEFHFQVKL